MLLNELRNEKEVVEGIQKLSSWVLHVTLRACSIERTGNGSTYSYGLTTAQYRPRQAANLPLWPMCLLSKTLFIHMGTDLENISHELSRPSLIYCMIVQETEFGLFYRNKTKEHPNKQQEEEIKVCILASERKRNILNIFAVISVFIG